MEVIPTDVTLSLFYFIGRYWCGEAGFSFLSFRHSLGVHDVHVTDTLTAKGCDLLPQVILTSAGDGNQSGTSENPQNAE